EPIAAEFMEWPPQHRHTRVAQSGELLADLRHLRHHERVLPSSWLERGRDVEILLAVVIAGADIRSAPVPAERDNSASTAPRQRTLVYAVPLFGNDVVQAKDRREPPRDAFDVIEFVSLSGGALLLPGQRVATVNRPEVVIEPSRLPRGGLVAKALQGRRRSRGRPKT